MGMGIGMGMAPVGGHEGYRSIRTEVAVHYTAGGWAIAPSIAPQAPLHYTGGMQWGVRGLSEVSLVCRADPLKDLVQRPTAMTHAHERVLLFSVWAVCARCRSGFCRQ